jgi:hypothetical protein
MHKAVNCYQTAFSKADLFAASAGAPIAEPVWRAMWNRGWLENDSEPIAPVVTAKGREEIAAALKECTRS